MCPRPCQGSAEPSCLDTSRWPLYGVHPPKLRHMSSRRCSPGCASSLGLGGRAAGIEFRCLHFYRAHITHVIQRKTTHWGYKWHRRYQYHVNDCRHQHVVSIIASYTLSTPAWELCHPRVNMQGYLNFSIHAPGHPTKSPVHSSPIRLCLIPPFSVVSPESAQIIVLAEAPPIKNATAVEQESHTNENYTTFGTSRDRPNKSARKQPVAQKRGQSPCGLVLNPIQCLRLRRHTAVASLFFVDSTLETHNPQRLSTRLGE